MRLLLLLFSVFMLSACSKEEEARYQLVGRGEGVLFRMNTKTGEIDVCGYNDKEDRFICVRSLRMINPPPPTQKPTAQKPTSQNKEWWANDPIVPNTDSPPPKPDKDLYKGLNVAPIQPK